MFKLFYKAFLLFIGFTFELIIASDLDYCLKHKIILCTGPSLGRYEMLLDSTESDLDYVPFKSIFVSTNDPEIMDIKFFGNKPDHCRLLPNRGKQLDCINCIISTLKKAVKHPNTEEDDIILFKHESLYINDLDLFKKAVSKIVDEGYNMVVRNMAQWEGIAATDAFFVKVSAIKKLIRNLYVIESFPPDHWFCELYFDQYIVRQVSNKYGIYFNHSNGGSNELGFYHHPSEEEKQRPLWNRKNRGTIYQQPSYYNLLP